MRAGDVFVLKPEPLSGPDDDESFLVVVDVEEPREVGEAAVAEVLVLTPANRIAPAARRLVLPVDDVERDWEQIEVEEAVTSYRVVVSVPLLVTAKDELEAEAVAKDTLLEHPAAALRSVNVHVEVTREGGG